MAAPRGRYCVFCFFFVLKALSNYICKEMFLKAIKHKLASKSATENVK